MGRYVVYLRAAPGSGRHGSGRTLAETDSLTDVLKILEGSSGALMVMDRIGGGPTRSKINLRTKISEIIHQPIVDSAQTYTTAEFLALHEAGVVSS